MEIKILVMGITGAGKSSFINYLLGREFAKTGIGRPVTQGITDYTARVNNIDLRVTDTKGLEIKDADEISESILGYLKENNLESSFFKRYHAVFFCVNLEAKRFNAKEADLVKRICGELHQPVNFIITNCDGLMSRDPEVRKSTDEAALSLESTIRGSIGVERCCIYRVCSVKVKPTFRNPHPIKAFGRDEIVRGLFDQVWTNASEIMAGKAAEQYEKALIGLLKKTYTGMNTKYSMSKGVFVGKRINAFKRAVDEFPTAEMREDFNAEIDKIKDNLEDYKSFICEYYYLFGVRHIDIMIDDVINEMRRIIQSAVDEEKIVITDFLHEQVKRHPLKTWLKISLSDRKWTEENFRKMTDNIKTKSKRDDLRESLFRKFEEVNNRAKEQILRLM